MLKVLLIFTLSWSLNSYAKLLDKVAGVVNDQIFTLSELKRVNKTIEIRKEIAPFIFKEKKYSEQEILKVLQNSYVIKDKLSELGFIIGDDAVESRIAQTQKGLNLSRAELVQFLSSKGISMIEYFELIRQAMEYNVFQRRIIGPLITITDQEMKNYYYKVSKDKSALSFKYEVVDYTLDSKGLSKSEINSLKDVFGQYRINGIIDNKYKNFDTNDLGSVADTDLPGELSSILKSTNENSFSAPYTKNGVTHIFYVSKKELVESEEFLALKPRIYSAIFEERSKKISETWLSREKLNYYTLNKL